MKKIIISLIIIILVVAIAVFSFKTTIKRETKTEIKSTAGLTTVLTLEDEISEDTIWCGTFQLIWNDLKNDLAKQDIVFNPQLKVVENLNKETFKETELSEESYYKTYGPLSYELKEKIEKAIKEKFNETSDILDDFNWEPRNSEDNYFLYAMLKKEFKFANAFEDLEKSNFRDTENVKYFGIKDKVDDYKKQVEVYYYNSSNDFAIKLMTDTNDEIILCKNPKGKTFNEIYNNINKEKDKYEGSYTLVSGDKLRIPNLKLNEKKEFIELENHYFAFSTGDIYYIEKALQTIQFELDKNGGKIKSEAGMTVLKNAANISTDEPREFILDDTFAIFLKEEEKNLPYFAARISDISKFQ